jgi:HD-like signal output (HDOD) protein
MRPGGESTVDVRLQVQRMRDLPTLPLAAQRLLDLLGDEDASVQSLVRAIEMDPGLTARIVGLANSAFFGAPSPVHSVSEAIIRVLGVDTVKAFGFSLAMSGSLRLERTPNFDLVRYWATALLTARMAQRLSPLMGVAERPDPQRAHLAGLLHNLGLLPLLHLYPVQMAEVLRIAAGAPEWTLAVVEQAVLGTDHHQVGAWLAHRWHLPADVVLVMQHHQELEYRGPHWPTVLVVGCCARWVQWRLALTSTPPADVSALDELQVPPDQLEAAQRISECHLEHTMELARMLARNR